MATESRASDSGSINDAISADLLRNILSRLPAKSFASASCVNRSWNSICSRILTSPKLSSAFSLNPSPEEAVNEVIEKVLSEPIRPQFAIVHVGPKFYPKVHRLIIERLGSEIPVVTCTNKGIIGRDALIGEFKEIIWEEDGDEEDFSDEDYVYDNDRVPSHGILLTVGYLPEVKANLIPLSSQDQELHYLLIDEFIKDVRTYTSSVSGTDTPSAIILFADHKADMNPILQKMGTGETQFHVALSTGMMPVGPKYKAASVKERYTERCTWLTARREGAHENLDGQTILDNIHSEMGERLQYTALHIGVRKRRKCSIGLEKVRWQTFLEFHEVLGGNEEYLFVNDTGIRTGDSFQLYASDSNIARSTCNNVSENFRRLKEGFDKKHYELTRIGHHSSNGKESVFGGLIFTCWGRGEPFLGRSNIDTLPFLENFPGVTIAGSFSNGEIKHGHTSEYGQEDEGDAVCFFHVFSTVYLVLSYIPAQQ